MTQNSTRVCKDCGVPYIPVDRHKSMRYYRCKKCRTALRKFEWKNRKDAISKSNRNSRIKRSYGISDGEYLNLLESQGGGCSICGSIDNLVIDHNHETGKVRGILCRGCNTGIGQFHDDPVIMEKAISYLINRKDGVS